MTVFATSASARSGQHALTRRSLLRAAGASGLAAALGGTALLSACGSGDIVSALTPSRFIVLGDGMSDVGQTGARYTINDGTVNTWADRLASRYSLTVTPASSGGLGYAVGHAADQLPSQTLPQQIDAMLAQQTLQANDVVLLNLPMTDVLQAAAAVKAGTLTETAALLQVDAAGLANVNLVKRLIAAGAQHVVVLGVYDLGKSPFAVAQDQVTFFSAATLRLNDAFKVDAVTLGTNLLFVDAAYLVNRNVITPTTYGFANATTAVCTTASAYTCTSATLVSGAVATQYLFADNLYLTPAGNQQLGDYAYDQLHSRW
jgi:phospholipase/lecithinase/hemolysin